MFNYAETIASGNTVMASILETLAETKNSKPAVTINLNTESDVVNSTKSRVFYTTGDRLEGKVCIVAPSDVRFDEIIISFEGWF